MDSAAAFLGWGAAASFDTVLGLNVAAVQLPYFLVGMTVIVGLVTLWKHPHRFVGYLLELLGAVLLARVVLVPLIRIFIQTARPYIALHFIPFIPPVPEYSFPSSHAAVLAALAFIAWSIRPAAGAALFAGAVIVGIARVLAGVHWPIDIVGGLFVGALAALIVHTLYSRYPIRA